MITRTDKPEIMIVDEVAAWLRCHPSSIYRLASRGKIPCAKYGREWRFRRDQLEEWIAIRDAESGRPVGGQTGRTRTSGVREDGPTSKT
jgi:excisionase family DNA binding protein